MPADAPASSMTGRIMIVDDEKSNIMIVRRYLEAAGYSDFVVTTDSTEALGLMRDKLPDVILLDIMMPQISGIEILLAIRADPVLTHIPVLILTASSDEQTKIAALELGATDFLPKPVSRSDLVPRVRNALVVRNYQEDLEQKVRLRTAELEASRLQVVHSLARAAEFRDDNTGRHVLRVGSYARIVAKALGLPDGQVDMLQTAALLHDVGKIGIPDSILLKAGPLDSSEFKVMQQHCLFGRKIIQPLPEDESQSPRTDATDRNIGAAAEFQTSLLSMAAEIALTHHERWDGSGYPSGLHGENIPLEGRITAVADVFDAVSSLRPYKPAFPVERCVEIIREGRSRHFDPAIADAFIANVEQILGVRKTLADPV